MVVEAAFRMFNRLEKLRSAKPTTYPLEVR